MNFPGSRTYHALLLVLLLAGSGTSWAATESLALIEVGVEAPALIVDTAEETVDLHDGATSSPILLLFLKPDDRYATQTIAAIEDLYRRFPMVAQGHRRAVIFSRFRVAQAREIPATMGDRWPVYRDRNDRAYHDYNIIATPSIVLVDSSRRVAAVQPGYDHSMPEWLLRSLAETLGVELPKYVTQEPERPNMALQMGRRMASRGLWERAAVYYDQAAEEHALSSEAQLERAGIHLELKQVEEALAILNALPNDVRDTERAAELRSRALREDGMPNELGTPPRVYR